jgi:hypothetical protein
MPPILSQDEVPSSSGVVNSTIMPLQRWGINIVGKLTPVQGNYTFTIIIVEYFTKWIEAKPLTNMSSSTIKRFF